MTNKLPQHFDLDKWAYEQSVEMPLLWDKQSLAEAALIKGLNKAKELYEPRWISVEEALPELEQDVWSDKGLVKRHSSITDDENYKQFNYRKYVNFPYDWGWITSFGGLMEPDYIKIWMPLPLPPKTEASHD